MTAERLRAATGPQPRPSAAEAVDDLYRAHGLGLIRFALMLVGDQTTAEDVVQEAFLGLYRGWHRVNDPGRALAYLRTAVLNGARSAHRSRSRARGLLLRAARHDPPVWSAEAASTTYPTSLSLSADGSLLGYVAFKTGGAWILPTGSPPGDAFGHSHEVAADGGRTETVAAGLSADSKTMYVVTATSSSRGPYTLTLAAYLPASGILVRKLHTWGNVSPMYPTGVTIGGNQLLVWGIYQPATFRVDLASGTVKSFWVFTPDGEFPESVAW